VIDVASSKVLMISSSFRDIFRSFSLSDALLPVVGVATEFKASNDIMVPETPHTWFEKQKLERDGIGIIREHYRLSLISNPLRIELVDPVHGRNTTRGSIAVTFRISGSGSDSLGSECRVRLVVNGQRIGAGMPCEPLEQSNKLQGIPLGPVKVQVQLYNGDSPFSGEFTTARSLSTRLQPQERVESGAWPLRCGVKPHADSPQPSQFNGKRPLVLLIWKQSIPWWHFKPQMCLDCTNPIYVVEDLECIEEADLIVWGCWNGVPGPSAAMPKPQHQKWIYFCLESTMEGHLGQLLGHESFLEDFDLISSFQLNSSFPRLYTPPDPNLLFTPPREKKRKVAWVASHCGRHNGNILRDAYVSELMKYIEVNPISLFHKLMLLMIF